MIEQISSKKALDILYEDAAKIRQLITNQNNHMCIAQCKAFEEVVDTQMYGYSREISYAVRLGVISNDEGQHLLSELEKELNVIYNDIYDEQRGKLEN